MDMAQDLEDEDCGEMIETPKITRRRSIDVSKIDSSESNDDDNEPTINNMTLMPIIRISQYSSTSNLNHFGILE